ncbi:MAG: hypothetical protein ACI4TU_00720, partial [Candidatus Cryptobacteroides sp.]
IRENLTIVQHCINTPKRKGTNSCYGMPAIILLASVIDTIGTFCLSGAFSTISKNDVLNNNLGRPHEHFDAFYTMFLKDKGIDRIHFVDRFYELGRCRATHNGVLGPNLKITINNRRDKPCIWEKRGTLNIQIRGLYELVREAFSQMLSNACSNNTEECEPTTGGTVSTSSTHKG